MKSTNYFDTFIEVAEDCQATTGEVPPMRGNKKSVATLQFEMLHGHPYEFTSDEVLFAVYATRQGIATDELAAEKERFFSKEQPCFRASPLTKRYGWGIHSNEAGKIALFGVESEDYQRLVTAPSVTKKKAMRSKKA